MGMVLRRNFLVAFTVRSEQPCSCTTPTTAHVVACNREMEAVFYIKLLVLLLPSSAWAV
jgi:hypothetical protein